MRRNCRIRSTLINLCLHPPTVDVVPKCRVIIDLEADLRAVRKHEALVGEDPNTIQESLGIGLHRDEQNVAHQAEVIEPLARRANNPELTQTPMERLVSFSRDSSHSVSGVSDDCTSLNGHERALELVGIRAWRFRPARRELRHCDVFLIDRACQAS